MTCSVYGLGISISRPIPRLAGAPAATKADVRIELNARPLWFRESLTPSLRYASAYLTPAGAPMLTVTELNEGWVRFQYIDGVDFFVDSAGSQIWVDWPGTLTIDDVSSYLLGPVLGFVLCVRGCACLHASAVAVDGRAVAIVGPPGAGKSTTAAAFGALGYGIMTDDVLALRETGVGFMACAGYPRLRLWRSSLTALSELGRALPELPDDWGGRRYHLDISRGTYAFQATPLPLGAVYVIAPRSASEAAPFVEPLPGNQTLLALVANTFAGRLLDRGSSAREFDAFSRIAAAVPVRRVTPHEDVRRLSRLCGAVVDDFRRAGQASGVSPCETPGH